MIVLGIETSCDETAAAVATEQGEVLSSVVASQLSLHAEYGGVVPELASRQHLRDLPRVAAQALDQAGTAWDRIEGVAATHGPGLMGALLVGLTWAKAAAFARGLPFVGVNHLAGHLKAVELGRPRLPRPFVGVVASGGHTNLYAVEADPERPYRLLARTRDDAIGEAFDKVAKLLGLSYPGGPAVERAAREQAGSGRARDRSGPAPFTLTVPRMKDGSLAFSYSGLKTAVRYHLDEARRAGRAVDPGEVAEVFQRTVITDLVGKVLRAAAELGARAVALTGGVAANGALRAALQTAAAGAGLECRVPDHALCTDNAAMIAAAGAERLARGERDPWDLPAVPYLEL